MNLNQAVDVLEEMGGIIRDHFTFPTYPTKSRGIRIHGNTYVDREKIYVNPEVLSTFSREIAELVRVNDIQTVVSDKNGHVLSYAVAHWISKLTDRTVFAVVAHKKRHGVFTIEKDLFDRYISGRKILIVEDIISSAVSIKGIKQELIRKSSRTLKSGNPVEVATIFNERGITAEDIGIPELVSLRAFKSWNRNECELCEKQIPIRGDVRLDRGITFHHI